MRSPAVERAVQVLDFLTVQHAQGFTASELSRRLRISKSTARILLATLADRALLERDSNTNGYRLGPALIPMGAVAEAAHGSLGHARRESEHLAEEYDGECVILMRTGEEVLIIGHAGIPQPGSTTFRAGQRQLLAPPLGTVMLAWAPDEAVGSWLGRLGPELSETERDRYRATLETVRQRGYAVVLRTPSLRDLTRVLADADLYTSQGREQISRALAALARDDYIPAADSLPPDAELASIAAPIFGPDGTMQFAISLAPGSAYRLRDLSVLSRAVLRAAGRVTAKIGGSPPEADRSSRATTRR